MLKKRIDSKIFVFARELGRLKIRSEDFYAKLQRQHEEIERFTQDTLARLADQNEKQRLLLSSSHKKLLEYFWNDKRKEVREEIPISVVYFFEGLDTPSQLRQLDESRVNVVIAELVAKGYLNRKSVNANGISGLVNSEILLLTKDGLRFIWNRHPVALIWWTKILDEMPDWTSLVIVIVGLIASVFGIVDFIGKYFLHMK